MSSQDSKYSSKDDFWDISDLIPKRSRRVDFARSIDAVELNLFSDSSSPNKTELKESGTVIKRYIPPHSDGTLTKREAFDFCVEYEPQNSLIHRVSLKKQTCSYQYYAEFLSDAVRCQSIDGEECALVPFFSYVPQYNQLTEEQRSYYFWYRENARRQIFLETEYSYLLLYVYELINLGDRLNVGETQRQLCALWHAYHEKFPAIEGKLADWICDFSLIHRLPPPDNVTSALVSKVNALKEFYIAMPDRDVSGCAKSLLQYCNSYDYKKSKFYKTDTTELFDVHIFGALQEMVRFYSRDGKLLSELTNEDSALRRDAYAGALCVAKERYRIEVEYCSFSRSNELRFLVGDVVKYVENRLRGYIGVKSRMSVYSVSTDLKRLLDTYLDRSLPPKRASHATREKQKYEELYDIPRKPLSLSDAMKIEQDSWSTTKDLIVAFDTEETACAEEVKASVEIAENKQNDSEIRVSFGDFMPILDALLSGESRAIHQIAQARGQMPESLADRINEIAFDVIGDTLVEETEDGYRILEEYKELFE